MRLLAVLLALAFTYVGVPMLWQYAMVSQINEMAKAEPIEFEVVNRPIPTVDPEIINAINPTIDIDTSEAEALAVESRANDAMRQARAASDMAWDATH